MLGRNCHLGMALHVFDHVVKPVLLYGSEIWGMCDIYSRKLQRCDPQFKIEKNYEDSLQQKVAMKFYKYAMGLPQTVTNEAVLG